jgi:hypothetical protein
VAVVENSCETETAAANRCGGGFSYHPQEGLVERDHGQRVALEPGGELKVTLTANALYPDIPWQIVESDASIVAVDGPQPLGAARSQG